MQMKADKADNPGRRPVFSAQYSKAAGASGKKTKPTQQDTLEYIANLAHQLQAMAGEIGEHGIAYYLQLARREALRSSQAERG
jgi:hypothetical protein